MKQMRLALAAISAVALLAACGDLGGITNPGSSGGNYPTSGGSNYPATTNQQLQGTVNNVDPQAQRIDLSVDTVDGRRVSTYTSSFYFDNRTRVVYNGQTTYTPTNLERGDRIDVRMYASNNGQPVADTITVVGDVRNPNSSSNPNTYPTYPSTPTQPYPGSTYPNNAQTTTIQGTVNNVDTRAQRIDLTSAYITGLRDRQNQTYSVYYDSRTQVLYQGQAYQPADLERGDQVEVRAFSNTNGQYQADTINVIRNVRQ